MSTASQTVTLRLPRELYDRTTELAKKRKKSLNALLQDGVRKLIEEDENRALSDGFDLLAQHPEECDVDYAIHAQSEIALQNEY
jgi:predicted DNA-binding protein